MAIFSVLLVTAPPPGQAVEAGGPFVKIDGREALLRSIELFLNRDNVRQIQLVVPADMLEEIKRKHGGHLGFSGVKLISATGRWVDQFAAAADKLATDCTHVLVHDAARPAVPYSDIDAIMQAAEKNPIVSLVSPVRSALLEVDEGGNALAYHAASEFVHLLTPQTFTKKKFLEIASSKKEPHASELTLIKGSPLNIRIGGPGDGALAKSMISMLPKPKIKPGNSPFEEAQW